MNKTIEQELDLAIRCLLEGQEQYRRGNIWDATGSFNVARKYLDRVFERLGR